MNTKNYLKHELGNSYKCSLPEEITIQVKTSDQSNLELDFVLCSIYITIVDHEDCYEYHFIPTDSNGQIKLTKDDIIYNTELQFYYDNKLPLDDSTVKFDIMITPKEFIRYFNHSAYKNDKTLESIKKNNKSDWHIVRWTFFMEMHDFNCKIIEKNKNLRLSYNSDESIISGNWTDSETCKYDLIMQL